jgi:hypothetical protein
VKALICEAYAYVAEENVEYVLFDTGSDIDITNSENDKVTAERSGYTT